MSETPPYAAPEPSAARRRRARLHHLQDMKQRGERWTMLIAHDTYAAAIVDDGGIPVLQYAHLHAAAHDLADDVVATDTFPGPEHTFASKA